MVHYLSRHEQAAIFAGIGYNRISGKIPVILVTPGPGVANIVSGLLSSHLELVPMIILTASIKNDQNYKYKINNLSEIAAKFSKEVHHVNSLREMLNTFSGIFGSVGDRYTVGGPFCVEICQQLLCRSVRNSNYILKIYKIMSLSKKIRAFGKSLKISASFSGNRGFRAFIDVFNRSNRPSMLIGRGCIHNGAYRVAQQISEKFKIPLVHSAPLAGTSDRNAYNFGLLGLSGDRGSYGVVEHSDLLVIIGARCHPRTIGPVENFAPNAFIARVDVDEYKFGFDVDIRANLNIKCDSLVFCRNWLNSIGDNYTNSYTTDEISPVSQSFEITIENGRSVNIEYFFSVLNRITGGKIPMTTGIGQNTVFAFKFYKPSDPENLILSSPDLGAMGSGLPAAIGASIAIGKKPVMVIDGDGSFQMSMQELMTLKELALPVLIFILNNRCLGLIKENEKRMFRARPLFAGLENPDFVKLASAFGIEGARISSDEEVEQALIKIFSRPRPYLLEVEISSDYTTVGNHVGEIKKL
jgi:acetolactate synthase-1/2/3 large subunit